MRIKQGVGMQLIIGVVLCILVLFLGIFFLVLPAKNKVSDAENNIKDMEMQIQAEQNKKVQLQEYQKDPEQFNRQLDILKERMPENVQLADVVEQIDHAAEESGLD